MEEGIMIGPEHLQKDTKDFNQKRDHVSEDGKIVNSPEGQLPDICAFVLFATNIDDSRRIGINYEYQKGINKNVLKAFTFEVPSDYSGDLRDLVMEQTMLQAGFEVLKDEVEYLGKSLVGSTESRFCHHFGISVNKKMQVKKTSSDPKVVEASHFWAMNEEVKDLQDWMAQITCIKRFTSKMSTIIINNHEQKK